MTEKNSQLDATDAEAASLRKLWLILATLSTIVGVNVLFAVQGGAIQFATAFGFGFAPDTPKAVTAFWGIILLNIFIFMQSLVALSHARMISGVWSDRYPIRIFELPTTRGIGRAATWLAILILTAFPGFMLGKSWDAMLQHGALCSEVDKTWHAWTKDWKPFFEDRPDNVQGGIRLTSDEKLKAAPGSLGICEDRKMTDYAVPGLTWGLAGLTLTTFLVAIWSLAAMAGFARGRQGQIGK